MLGQSVSGQPMEGPRNRSDDTDVELELRSLPDSHITKLAKPMDSPSTFASDFGSQSEQTGQTTYPEDSLAQQKPQEEGFQGVRLGLLATSLSLVVFLISLDRVTITTAIPHITHEFSSSSDIGWYGSAYLITACAFQPVYGRIYTMFSMKWTYLTSLTIFDLGSLACAAAPNSTIFIIGRAVAGYGSAGLLTGSFVIVASTVPLPKRPFYTSLVGTIFAFGAIIGPLIGGLFTDLLSWRWCFYINLPVGATTALAFLLLFWRVPPKMERLLLREKLLNLDIVGNVFLLGAAIMLFISIEFTAQGKSWSNTQVVCLMVGFGVTALLFIAWQWYMQDMALIPPSIVKQRTLAASSATAFVVYGAVLLHAYFLPIWFQTIRGESALQSGVNMLPYFIISAFFGVLGGAFVSAVGYYVPPALVGSILATVGSGLLTLLAVDTSKAKWAGFEVVAAAGFGLVIQQGFTAVQATIPKDQSPIGTALIVCFQSLGGSIFISVGNNILHSSFRGICERKGLPEVDFQKIFSNGVTAFQDSASPESLPALLEAYNDALSTVFYVPVLLAGLALVFSCFLEWSSVKSP